jgi:hypothetical protein
MKTSVKKIGIFVFALLAFSTLFTSCQKEEEVKTNEENEVVEHEGNIRAQAIGIYDYTLEYYTPGNNGSLDYLGNEYDDQGTMEVKGEQGTNYSFSVLEDGEELFRGVGISPVSVGFSFSVPGQQYDDGELQISIKGYENWEMDGDMHEGLFRSDSAELRAAFEAEVDGVVVIMLFRAFKR